MTRRDHFTAAALTGLLAAGANRLHPPNVARSACEFANHIITETALQERKRLDAFTARHDTERTTSLREQLNALTQKHGFDWAHDLKGITIIAPGGQARVEAIVGEDGIEFDRLTVEQGGPALETIMDLAEEFLSDAFNL